MIKKRFNWKRFYKRAMWASAIIIAGWAANLVWFKPFSIELFYERMFFEYSLEHPEFLTRHHSYEKYSVSDYAQKLNDISTEQLNTDMEMLIKNWDMLKSYRFNKQSPDQQISTKILDFYWETAVYMQQYNHILFLDYPINHIDGTHISLIDFMLNTHEIKTLEDAENYLERLKVAPDKLYQMMNKFEFHTIPPAPILDKIIVQIETFVKADIQDNLLYKDFFSKIDSVENIPDYGKTELKEELKILIAEEIIPIYSYLLDELRRAKDKAVPSAGIWQLEMGELYYQDLLRFHVTRHFTKAISAENMALDVMEEMLVTNDKIRLLLDSLGYEEQDSLHQVFAKMQENPALVYENTADGKAQFLNDFKKLVESTNDEMSKVFDVHVERSLEIKQMVTHQKPYTSRLFYYPASLDDYRKARIFVNTDSVNYIPKFMMSAMIHNYVTPGEHFVKTVQHHLSSKPTFRRALQFDAYIDGWSFYAQRHLKEGGYFYDDPYQELGRLYQELLRASAAMTDYNIHKERYEREDGILVLMEITGLPKMEAEAIVDRIIVDPGRAFAYWAGYKKIMELRDKAKTQLQERFNLKEFHQAVLNCGPVPLVVLEMAIDQYIESIIPKEKQVLTPDPVLTN